jgi:diguanylate cyclase (GGDEF)-like protein
MSGTDPRSRVLAVDDEALVQEMLQGILQREFDARVVGSGAEAAELLRKERFDAVVADHLMPGMTGVEVLTIAREVQPNAARVLVTASSNVDHARDAINVARVGRYVAKPFRALELVEIVRGAISEQALAAENVRILEELRQKNALLEKALSEVQAHERKLVAEVERQTSELRGAVAKLEELALRDGLTGLYNHRFFQEALNSELARCSRHGRLCSLLFLDVDNFKHYNDALGHLQGDELLRQLAHILTNTGDDPALRARGRVSDLAARYGGEEFVVILPECDRAGGVVRAERLRAQIEQYPFAGGDRQPGGKVTVSIGVAAYPADALSKQELIHAADQALLRAKREGRNRVRAAGESMTQVLLPTQIPRRLLTPLPAPRPRRGRGAERSLTLGCPRARAAPSSRSRPGSLPGSRDAVRRDPVPGSAHERWACRRPTKSDTAERTASG